MNTKTTDYLIAAILILTAIATLILLPLMAVGTIPQTVGIIAFRTAFFLIACLIIVLLIYAPHGRYR